MTTSVGVQQSQAQLTYNINRHHPCGDLLEGGRRREYLEFCVPLYKALIQRDWEDARVVLQDHEYLVRYSITEFKETPLHIVVAAAASARRSSANRTRWPFENILEFNRHVSFARFRDDMCESLGYDAKRRLTFVRELVSMMEKDDLKLKNEDGNTALCTAAIAGGHKMARIMVHKNPELLKIRGSQNMMPLQLAAFHGNYDMVRYLYEHSQQMASTDGWTDDEKDMVFLKCIQADFYDVALKILDDNEHKQFPQERHLYDVLYILARKTKVFLPPIVTACRPVPKFLRQWESEATLLLRKIWKRIVEKPKDEIDAILKGPMIEKDGVETYPSPILFVAAEKGNKGFVVELIYEYPELVLKTNDDGHTIFHIAALQHHEKIYNLLYNIGSMTDRVIQLIDKEDNNMLHLASKKAPGRNQEKSAGAELRSRMSLFKKVKAMVPPSFKEMRNAQGLTPYEVLTVDYKEVMLEGEKRMKDSVAQGMVVAALVASIGFAAAITFPGGYDQDTGFPMFPRKLAFMVFVIADAISFILSSASILIFLSHTVAPYSRSDSIKLTHDSIEFMPSEMTGGFLLLYLSVMSLSVAFSAIFFLLQSLPLALTICFCVYLIPFSLSVSMIQSLVLKLMLVKHGHVRS